MSRWNQIKSKGKKATPFEATHSEIETAVSEYLKKGGEITKLEVNESNYIDYIKFGDSSLLADEFLSGQ